MKGRVTIVTPALKKYGGIEKLSFQIGQVLGESGYKVNALSTGMEYKKEKKGKVTNYRIKPLNKLLKKIYGKLRKYFIRYYLHRIATDSNLILVTHFHLLPPVLNFARLYNKCVWLVAHGIEIWPEWSKEEKKNLSRTDRIIAVSHYTANSVSERLEDSKGKVEIINNMVNTKLFTPPSSSRNNNPLVILTVARLSASERYKGHDLIIRALPTVNKVVSSDLEYWIVGDGDDRTRLKNLAVEEGVYDLIDFKGRVDQEELLDSYRSCNVFAMPSYVSQRGDGSWTGEGFGIVYIEASACGVPIIACNEGGQTDAVLDERTGLLVEPKVESVENALIELLKDKQKRESMGQEGRKFVEENFSRDVFKNNWTNLLNEHLVNDE